MTILIIKIAAAGLIVLVFSIVAERVGPRLAGILMGAPFGALISYYFVGHEAGPAFVAAGVPHAVAGLVGTLAFAYVYYWVTAWAGAWPPLMNAATGTLAGVAVFLAWAAPLHAVELTIPRALAILVPFMVLFTFLFRRAGDIRVRTPARLTLKLMCIRAGGAAVLVAAVSTIAVILGPAWGGLLMGFPMTMLPTMLIIHLTYTKEHVHAFLGAFPVGLGSLVVYAVIVSDAFPRFGVDLGTAVSLAGAYAYLAVLPLAFRLVRKLRPVSSGPGPGS